MIHPPLNPSGKGSTASQRDAVLFDMLFRGVKIGVNSSSQTSA
jgi:hypothetical protein